MKRGAMLRRRRMFSVLMSAALMFIFVSTAMGSGGEEGGAGITVLPDPSVFIQIVNFLFLVWVMNALVWKPIRKILLQRKDKISGLQQGVEETQEQARNKDSAYSQGLKAARIKGLQEKEKFLEAAADEERAIIDKINQKAQEELADIRSKIFEDTENVRASLEKEIDSFADAIGNKILGRAI